MYVLNDEQMEILKESDPDNWRDVDNEKINTLYKAFEGIENRINIIAVFLDTESDCLCDLIEMAAAELMRRGDKRIEQQYRH